MASTGFTLTQYLFKAVLAGIAPPFSSRQSTILQSLWSMLSSKNTWCDLILGINVSNLPASAVSPFHCHHAQSSLIAVVCWAARCLPIHFCTFEMPSTVLHLSSRRIYSRPSRLSVFGGGDDLTQLSHDFASGPFVNVSSIKTGPCWSLYRVCKLWILRSGTPGTVPSIAPVSSVSLLKMGCLPSQNTFHSVFIFSWSLPNDRKIIANWRFDFWRLATMWKRLGNMLYVGPLRPAIAASLEYRISGGSCILFIVSANNLSISFLTGVSSRRLNDFVASLRSFLSRTASLQY
mmetsp:Transcript_51426/g.146843  ORF Transcript_51426/g.146843 Transcript_51426/m.146843 type:complete len:291 (-) Transcript_51426:34-906(-)